MEVEGRMASHSNITEGGPNRWRARMVAVALLVAIAVSLAAVGLDMLAKAFFPTLTGRFHPSVFTDLAMGLLAGLATFVVLARFGKYHTERANEAACRRRAEAAMEERRHVLEMVIEAIPHPFFYKDRNGLYQGCNKAFAAFLGLPRERILGHGVHDVAPPELAAKYQAADEALFRQPGQQVYESQVESRDGRRRTVVFHKATFEGPDGRLAGIVGSILDITEWREAENRTRLSVAILNVLNQNLGYADTIRHILRLIRELGVDAVGLRLREGDDYPYYATNGFTDDFVRLENKLAASDSADCLRDESGGLVLECLCGMVLKGKFLPGMPCMTPSGSFWTNAASELRAIIPESMLQTLRIRGRCPAMGYESIALVPLRSHDEVLGLLQINYRQRDALTLDQVQFFEGLGASIGVALRRKRWEEQLVESEAAWHRIFEGMHEGILAADIETMKLVLANDAVCRMLGYSRDELLELHVRNLHGPEDWPDVVRRPC